MTQSGRWLLQYACGISSYFDLPWLIGLLCAVYLGITAAAVTELFDIKNPVVIVLAALVLAASPSTTETFFFEYTADGYMIGLLLSALAACLSCKGYKWWHYVLSGVCLCCSCAIYQAYVSFAIVLCICWLVLRLLDDGITVKDALKWIGKHVIIYGAAMAAYYGVWKLILFTTNRTATGYQGINDVGLSVTTILNGILKSVKNILFFYLEWNILEHPITLYAALNMIFVVALAAIVITAVVKSRIYKTPGKLSVLLLCLVVCVPAISIWCLVSEGVSYRPMMLHSLNLFYILALLLFDRWVCPKVSTVFGLLMAVMVFNFAVMANISYFYLHQCYERSYYIGSQMMERIEEAEEDHDIQMIAFIGERDTNTAVALEFPGNRIHLLTNLLEEDLCYSQERSYRYLKMVFGMEIPLCDNETLEKLQAQKAVGQMSTWPAEDSVQVIDGILVIKLQEIP